MQKSISIIIIVFLITTSSCSSQIFKGLKLPKVGTSTGSLSKDEVAKGLKEALKVGISKGADLASSLDGYYKHPVIKIPFPPEVQQVESRLRQIGLGSEVDKFILSLNRAAEDAAKQSKPIFVKAITSLTIQDAFGILNGNNDAATQYLKRTTTSDLTNTFLPVIKSSLEKVNATKYYRDLVNAYNRIPLVTRVNPNLNEYATEKAIEGLFYLIAQEEANIRANPQARTTELLRKVFSQAK
ncbi:MAG TPA: DUF4197 domain-containing protein [Cytophagales bacterium]|nr:DUF4197 domain-containing protein [Cytophagales bacterium]